MGYMERKDATSALEKPEVPAELKKMLGDALSAIQALDSKAEDTKRNATDALLKYNDLNEKYAREWADHKKAVAEVEKKAAEADSRVKDLEVKLATSGGSKAKDERDTPEFKAFYEYFSAYNIESVKPETKTLLRTDQDTAGGYLVPPTTDSNIRKKLVELSPVRAFATQRPMSSKTMTVPLRLALLDSSYEGEAEIDNVDASKYGTKTVTAWRHQTTVPITRDQLIMSPFDMESQIASDVGQSFAKKEGNLFLKGTGNKMPEGMLTNAQVLAGKTTSAATGIVNFDDIANLIGSMKVGYNPMLFMNRLTFARLLQLKTTIGSPLWQPVAGEKPATIWDQPYTASFIDMDSLIDATYSQGTLTANATSATIPIMYADLAQAYEIYDLAQMTVIRDDVTRKRYAIIEYTFARYNTGGVIMPEAIKILKVK